MQRRGRLWLQRAKLDVTTVRMEADEMVDWVKEAVEHDRVIGLQTVYTLFSEVALGKLSIGPGCLLFVDKRQGC